MRRALLAATALALAWSALPARAQPIEIDRGVRAAGLWCFPRVGEPSRWAYLPAGAGLATREDGSPVFSFVRYASTTRTGDSGPATITRTGGGGIVHFLVELRTPAETVREAEEELRRQLREPEVVLEGPMVFVDGRYLLVSSILRPGTGDPRRELLASGRAPVLEGNRLAFSFELAPEAATLLFESFQMSTPDVSVVFDMTFQGLADAYEAELVIDWAEVHRSEALGAGASLYFVSADVDLAFEELRRENAIRLVTSGSDTSMEALLTTVYTRLLDLLFRPVEPQHVPEDQRGGLVDAIAALADPSGPAGSRNTTGFGAYVGYQLKDLRSSGLSVLDFHHRATVDRHSFVTFNIGDLYDRYGDDPAYFRAVNLEDPTFQQREIHVAVDGALLPDFDDYVNSVTVTLRKRHESGDMTLRELVVDRATVEESAGALSMVYGWSGDENRTSWLDYEVRTRWSFRGGGVYETEWTHTNAAMIELFAPFERRVVQLSGDPGRLEERGVRAVVVEVEYPFFDRPRRQQMVVRSGEPIDAKSVEITLPLNQYSYNYSITWRLVGGQSLTTRAADSSGLIFVDEVPEVADG